MPHLGLRLALFHAGGVLVQGATVAAVALAFGFHPGHLLTSAFLDPAACYVASALLLIASCLFPLKAKVAGRMTRSDGLQLARLIARRHETIREMLDASRLESVVELIVSRDFAGAGAAAEALAASPTCGWMARWASALVLIATARFDEAIESLTMLGASAPVPVQAGLARYLQCWALTLRQGEQDLRQALLITKALVREEPANARYADMHSVVLVALGTYGEAIGHLRGRVRPDKPLDKEGNTALNHLVLSFAYCEAGDRDAARRCLNRVASAPDSLPPDDALLAASFRSHSHRFDAMWTEAGLPR